jgi:D-alanyl-D-alanine carboxypeptidase
VWLVRGITSESIHNDRSIKSSAFYTEELSVDVLSLSSVGVLMADRRFRELAAVKTGYCRQLGLEVEASPNQTNPDHVVVLLGAFGASQRQKRAKLLRDAAEKTRVRVTGSPQEVYETLRARCEELDRGDSTAS